jgi:hypothetical protein
MIGYDLPLNFFNFKGTGPFKIRKLFLGQATSKVTKMLTENIFSNLKDQGPLTLKNVQRANGPSPKKLFDTTLSPVSCR